MNPEKMMKTMTGHFAVFDAFSTVRHGCRDGIDGIERPLSIKEMMVELPRQRDENNDARRALGKDAQVCSYKDGIMMYC
jgi:hypothetical protein